MQVDLIFPLRAHLEGSIQMSKTAGISHIHCIKREKKSSSASQERVMKRLRLLNLS